MELHFKKFMGLSIPANWWWEKDINPNDNRLSCTRVIKYSGVICPVSHCKDCILDRINAGKRGLFFLATKDVYHDKDSMAE